MSSVRNVLLFPDSFFRALDDCLARAYRRCHLDSRSGGEPDVLYRFAEECLTNLKKY